MEDQFRILALDLGVKSCGFAISDHSRKISFPLEQFNFTRYDFEKVVQRVNFWLKEYQISLVVLGYPTTLSGKISPRTKMIEHFAKIFKKSCKIKLFLQDERLSTKEAELFLLDSGLSFQKRKKIIDKMAAQIILERYLHSQNGNKKH
ncbi:Holliday junction resolvase RuvX [Mycoplasma sp. 'Moose RK']|uniref:Holliday junction resolvase RuvX n=1 Tax=Mycoplasma sp. 'Moose RK' TaxID=2780095 RepID=UPI0018C1E385|nr:Holliday junction resolvase RuvX [Mycoplasma sp. 'Moose RK']MBG0730597.1 Holliday junction resolvase RuvX [Mycoplasma sp. 'Moose RK']